MKQDQCDTGNRDHGESELAFGHCLREEAIRL